MAPWISSGVQGALNAGDKLSNNQRSLTKKSECLARMRGDLSGSQVELWQEKCVSRCIFLLYVHYTACINRLCFSHSVKRVSSLIIKNDFIIGKP